MKNFILIFLVLSFTSAFTQQHSSVYTDTSGMLPAVYNYKTHGYIDGIRLDSVNAQYAEFGWQGVDGVSFYYGQNPSKRKDLFVRNRQNIPLIFTNRDRAFLLNFFYYNGWELANITNPQSDGRFVLKRINK
ncbi:MAG TPA: hypothetical protein VNT20_14010 [Flavisolibacter sp.]|jgi:hypothetical protein|nr:hypothetical protein [Flavisolibacter sp.]